ncbi:MAG: hypothetical protein NWR96_01000 [Crocinitomicaceae bacterium]|nr:hypothetical protein [Crocinitomicaceae bacterium]MDP4760183.1 hypothetical protein [Crocinitomicaceae bacterium]
MKKLTLISLFISIFSHALDAQKSQAVTTGVFINSLYDLDFPGESFKVDMWIWCNYMDSSIKMNEMIEFPKTKEFNFSNQVTEKRGKYQWMTMRGTGEVIKKWNVKDFPFDRQELNIALGYSFDTSTFKVEADVLNSKIDPDFKLAGWNIDKVVFSRQNKTYKTSFGDPLLKNGKSVYPEFNADIFISRSNSMMTLLKLIMGLIIAFIISCCIFFIKPRYIDARLGLCVGGLFTAVGNKYITDSIVPSTNELTLVDNLHLLTFFCIFLIVIHSVVSLNIIEKQTEDSVAFSRKIDLISFISIGIIFTGGMIGLTLSSY